MLKDKISGFVDTILSVEGISACALISRDGIVVGKSLDRQMNEPWFGALSATILASAESMANLTRMPSTDSVTIRCSDAVIMVMSAGEKFLVATILQRSTDPAKVHDQLVSISKTIGKAM